MSEPVAMIYPSPGRRWFGTVTLAILGVLLIYTALANPASALVWTLILMLAGGIAIWGAISAFSATGRGIALTPEGLFDTEGQELARLEDMVSVVSGPLSFKPSNGFTVRLRRRHKAGWAPGLWWRLGPLLGVGGMTTGVEAKYMAELISEMIAARDAGQS